MGSISVLSRHGKIIYDDDYGHFDSWWEQGFPNHNYDEIYDLLSRGIASDSRFPTMDIFRDDAERINILFRFEPQENANNDILLGIEYTPGKKEMRVVFGAEKEGEAYRRPISSSLASMEAYALANLIELAKQLGVTSIVPTRTVNMGAVLWPKLGLEVSLPDQKSSVVKAWKTIQENNPNLPADVCSQVETLLKDYEHTIPQIAALRHVVEVKDSYDKPTRMPLGAALMMKLQHELAPLDPNHLPAKLQNFMQRLEKRRQHAETGTHLAGR